MTAWSLAEMPDQTGRTVVVTGPTLGGLGYFAALELARRGARVVLAGRTPARLDEAADSITAEIGGADVQRLVLDLASLDAVRAAAERAADLGAIDVLVNNAGVMASPYSATVDGFSLQMATNHFGPFLLTGLLLPQLAASGAGRVVTVSSQMHRLARRPPLADPRVKPRHYSRWAAYSETKLANLLFTFELDRRAAAATVPASAVAAHPGLSGTHLIANGRSGWSSGGVATIFDAAAKAMSQPAAMGALPLLMAATADLPGSTYCGPSGFHERGGLPTRVGCSARARDPDAARRLWELSEDAVGLSWP
jgi:NAD(P)-dependent dehydrogenase (short-subunit alcohol dehydrogenase family)